MLFKNLVYMAQYYVDNVLYQVGLSKGYSKSIKFVIIGVV